MTYAKLARLGPAELDTLRPDAVILDEMHRAAAPTWEMPVQTLLSKKSRRDRPHGHAHPVSGRTEGYDGNL
jgi:hypothetical protein